jgi:hypothetical protein
MFTARYELSLKVYFKSDSLFQTIYGEEQQIIYVYKLLFYVLFWRFADRASQYIYLTI